MDNNFTVIASLCTAFAAIMAPLVTTLITNIHNYRVKKLQLVYTKKLDAINDFAHKFIFMRDDGKPSSVYSFVSSANCLIPLCKKAKTRIAILNLSKTISTLLTRTPEVYDMYNECLELLAKETT